MKMRVMTIGVCGLIFSFLASGAFAEEKTEGKEYQGEVVSVSDAIAIINDKTITTKDLFSRLYKLNGQQVLNQMIDELLVRQEGEKQGIKISNEEVKVEIERLKQQFKDEQAFNNQLSASGMSVEELREQIELQTLTKQLLIKEKGIAVTDAEIKAYFEENTDKLKKPEQLRVSHILVETEREAKDVLLALEAGADFSKLAKAKSIDTATKDKGGDTGFFTKGSILPEFESAAFNLKKAGDISGVVKTQLGYHIIRLEERKEPQPAGLTEEIKEKIKAVLLQQKIQTEMPGWIQELRNKAKIEIVGIKSR